MKTIYTIAALLSLTIGLNAQTTKVATKATGKYKTKSAVTPPKKVGTPVMVEAPAMDDHAGHNHTPAAATPALIDIAKPVAEDNLGLAETTYNFGKIIQAKPVTHDFAFANSGKSELVLDNVVAGCGCTTPTWDKTAKYKAGDKGQINVGFNAGGVGAFTKTVTITYNGGLTKQITITGEVYAAPATPAPENKGVQMLNGKQ